MPPLRKRAAAGPDPHRNRPIPLKLRRRVVTHLEFFFDCSVCATGLL